MKLQESGENYLETILLLKKKKNFVRSVDVAEELGYSKPSISRAMGPLREAGLITMGEGGNIEFTETGLQRAEGVYERHTAITRFLMDTLGVSEEMAEENACRIEHIISQELFEQISAYVTKKDL